MCIRDRPGTYPPLEGATRIIGSIALSTACLLYTSGRPEAGGAGGGAEQVAGADRLEAGEGHEVDVGVELGAGAVDLVPGGLGAPARGDHVGTVAQQVQRHAVGHATGGRGQGGLHERLAALRAGACLLYTSRCV